MIANRYHLTQAYRGGNPQTQAPGWWLHTSYDEDLVASIKSIPSRYRSWDEDRERWWIAAEYETIILALFPGFAAYLHQGRLL